MKQRLPLAREFPLVIMHVPPHPPSHSPYNLAQKRVIRIEKYIR